MSMVDFQLPPLRTILGILVDPDGLINEARETIDQNDPSISIKHIYIYIHMWVCIYLTDYLC